MKAIKMLMALLVMVMMITPVISLEPVGPYFLEDTEGVSYAELVDGFFYEREGTPFDFDGQTNNFDLEPVDFARIYQVGEIAEITINVRNRESIPGAMWVQCSILDFDIHSGWLSEITDRQGQLIQKPTADYNCQDYEPFTQAALVYLDGNDNLDVTYKIPVPNYPEDHDVVIYCANYEDCQQSGAAFNTDAFLRDIDIVAVGDQICVPGQRRCTGERSFERCNSDGTAWFQQDFCAEDQVCAEWNGACIDACENEPCSSYDQIRCTSDFTYRKCVQDGEGCYVYSSEQFRVYSGGVCKGNEIISEGDENCCEIFSLPYALLLPNPIVGTKSFLETGDYLLTGDPLNYAYRANGCQIGESQVPTQLCECQSEVQIPGAACATDIDPTREIIPETRNIYSLFRGPSPNGEGCITYWKTTEVCDEGDYCNKRLTNKGSIEAFCSEVPAQRCSRDSDCDSPVLECNNDLGECILKTCNVGEKLDPDTGDCERIQECSRDSDCDNDEECVNGECRDGEEPGPTPDCSNNLDCDREERCKNGECIPDPTVCCRVPGREDVTTSEYDCRNNEIVNTGVCQGGTCDVGEELVEGVCQPKPDPQPGTEVCCIEAGERTARFTTYEACVGSGREALTGTEIGVWAGLKVFNFVFDIVSGKGGVADETGIVPDDDCTYAGKKAYSKGDAFCVFEAGQPDKCYERKEAIPLSEIEKLDDFSWLTDIIAKEWISDPDTPICLKEYGDVMCEDDSECLVAKNSDRPRYKDNKIVYDSLKDITIPFFGKITAFSYLPIRWITKDITGTEPVEAYVQQFGVCAYDDRSVFGDFKRTIAGIFGLEADDPLVTYIIIGMAILVIVIIFMFISPPRPRRRLE